MSAIEKFFNGKSVRVIVREETPWFIARDVFEILGISWNSSSSIDTLSDSMKSKITKNDVEYVDPSLGGSRHCVLECIKRL
jgi:prophage antirepressor-like protein